MLFCHLFSEDRCIGEIQINTSLRQYRLRWQKYQIGRSAFGMRKAHWIDKFLQSFGNFLTLWVVPGNYSLKKLLTFHAAALPYQYQDGHQQMIILL